MATDMYMHMCMYGMGCPRRHAIRLTPSYIVRCRRWQGSDVLRAVRLLLPVSGWYRALVEWRGGGMTCQISVVQVQL